MVSNFTMCLLIAGDQTTSPSGPGRVAAMLAVLTGLLVAFFLGVVLLTLMRRRRQRRNQTRQPDVPLTDPWREAGRRAEPFGESRRDRPAR